MNITKRHHYIPEFLIKGFVGDDRKISVFNKETCKIDNNRKSPKQVFFEWNRSTFKVGGIDNDLVERLYQFGETKFSETYRIIIEKEDNSELNAFEKLHLIYFISELHWRLPAQGREFLEHIKTLKLTDSILKIRNTNSEKSVSQYQFSEIIKNPIISEAFKMIKAMEDFEEIVKEIKIQNWKLYYVEKNHPQLNLLSDNPIIVRNTEQNILKSELIFPLSKGKTIYNTNGKTLIEIPAENRIKIDTLAFLQAKKFVCGPKAEYLRDIAEYAKFYDTKNKIEDLKENIFDIFK